MSGPLLQAPKLGLLWAIFFATVFMAVFLMGLGAMFLFDVVSM